jgi:N-acetylglucosaminyldiphosphoundecaprenol N-acetyl-beta-D-mannosaminyltransferase
MVRKKPSPGERSSNQSYRIPAVPDRQAAGEENDEETTRRDPSVSNVLSVSGDFNPGRAASRWITGPGERPSKSCAFWVNCLRAPQLVMKLSRPYGPIMERLNLLGVELDALDIPGLNSCISEAVRRDETRIIANHNLHSVYLYHQDPRMREFYRKADVSHIDGMSLVFWGRFMGHSLRWDERVTYVDWLAPLMASASQNGWRVFYLGGRVGVAKKAADILQAQMPGLQISTHHGFFANEESPSIVQEISRYQPHILMVAMGMPRQEYWILDNLDHLQANAILTAGGCFDYVAGIIPTPPRWMGKAGLEWLFRLKTEPRRLWRRYLLEPWFLLKPATLDALRRLGIEPGRS